MVSVSLARKYFDLVSADIFGSNPEFTRAFS